MGFAGSYLEKKALFEPFTSPEPHGDTWIIVVIPAYNEPSVAETIASLEKCDNPGCIVEIIVVFNAPPGATESELEVNRKALIELESRANSQDCVFTRLFLFDTGRQQQKEWGAGMARKTGMDEALRRFDAINRRDGAIVSLDADCTVSPDYLVSIYRELCLEKERKACSIYFVHPFGKARQLGTLEAVIQYELHMRYYYRALIFTGFPDVFHTVGSAMAVKAEQYCRAGGMNRRQGGEDFYFIQKIIPQGGMFYLRSAAVYPSPRRSVRVPFGTGPAIDELAGTPGKEYYTYNPGAFINLRELFSGIDDLYMAGEEELEEYYLHLPDALRRFTGKKEWTGKLTEINSNTSSLPAFRKRFFNWFNMFRVVKFLNFAHSEGLFERVPAEAACRDLLQMTGVRIAKGTAGELLEKLRAMEKQVTSV